LAPRKADPPAPGSTTAESRPAGRAAARGAAHGSADIVTGPSSAISPEHLLSLIRTGTATSRAALSRVTGLSRSTIAQRVDALIEAGYVREGGPGTSSGGRPPAVLEFDGSRKFLLAAAIDPTRLMTGVVNLAGEVVARRVSELRVADGPAAVLPLVEAELRAVREASGVGCDALSGLGVAVPAPVDYRSGRPIEPTIMPGWHDCPIREELGATFGLPVYVDNDANVMALAEYRTLTLDAGDMLYVRSSDGIGAGLILNGRLYRGAVGAAGALGHTTVDGAAALCTCGNVGCVAAIASGQAIARRLRDEGFDARGAADVADLASQGREKEAAELLREAGRDLGRVLAGVVNLLNPGTVVIGGELAEVRDYLAGIRQEVYARALPLAAAQLRILRASLGRDAGIRGAAALVAEELLAPRPVIDVLLVG
jgi:predicted NBD/HSP70 family sugar kinase